jgi:hypothetical protein
MATASPRPHLEEQHRRALAKGGMERVERRTLCAGSVRSLRKDINIINQVFDIVRYLLGNGVTVAYRFLGQAVEKSQLVLQQHPLGPAISGHF